MLGVMSDRGPDSAGFAIYGEGRSDRVKLTLRDGEGHATEALAKALAADLPMAVDAEPHDTHLVVSVPRGAVDDLSDWLRRHHPRVDIVAIGNRMEIFKEVGRPPDVAARFGLAEMSGTHGIGHTRMATESAVTTNGAHPFSTGRDQCLVHNGSLSNHHALRRMLTNEGIVFKTQNDSEVAAGYLTWRMREGDDLATALRASLGQLDGFFTFVVGTESGFAVLRDPISCKPAVMVETADYVAFGSEYRALAGLPGIERARIFEPEPATVYAWEH
jgi:glutamate synthase domain-containing protein 1